MACSPIGAYDRRKNQYEKTLVLDERTKKICALAKAYGLDDLLAEVDALGTLPQEDFDKHVNTQNMHPWLSGLMHLAEKRYALAITKLLELDEKAWSEVQQLVKEEAETTALALPQALDCEGAFQYLLKLVLDGMPCEEVREVKSISDQEVTWENIADTHARFWLEVGGDVEHYYTLLDLYLNTLFAKNHIKFVRQDQKKFALIAE